MEAVKRTLFTEVLISLLVQLSDEVICTIRNRKVVNSSAYTVLQRFEIIPKNKPKIGGDGLCFRISSTDIPLYIDLLRDTDLIEFLPDSIFFIDCEKSCEILIVVYSSWFCVSDKFVVEENFIKQCEDADFLFQSLYLPLHQEILIHVLSQLPDGAILAIDDWELEDCNVFQAMKQFRVQEKIDNFEYCYRINKTDLPVYIDWVWESDLPSFLIHFIISPPLDSEDKKPLVVVYDSCIFCLSNKIVIDEELVEQADRAHLYIQKL